MRVSRAGGVIDGKKRAGRLQKRARSLLCCIALVHNSSGPEAPSPQPRVESHDLG